jgi:CHASE1-domain containing sensor protein
MKDDQAMRALEWVPRVPVLSERNLNGSRARTVYPEFELTERNSQGQLVRAGVREEHFPVRFVEPYKGNEAALGFDQASSPHRLKALSAARDSGLAVASGRIQLIQSRDGQSGFLVFQPIYAKGLPNTTIAERRQNLLGFALAVFNVRALVESSVGNLAQTDIDIKIYDEDGAPDEQLLYSSSARIDSDKDSDGSGFAG